LLSLLSQFWNTPFQQSVGGRGKCQFCCYEKGEIQQRVTQLASLVMFGSFGGMLLTLAHANRIMLLVLVAVINGVVVATILAVVMLVSGSRRIMGREYANGLLAKTLGWLTTLAMAAAAVGLFATGAVSV
jgi:Mn2+/Fe2+ NRAMP family transporter